MTTLNSLGYQKINNILPVNFCNKTSQKFTDEVIKTQPMVYNWNRGWVWKCYNPAEMQEMYKQVQSKIETVVGEKLLPTYCFITGYTNNSYMISHKDRPSCEISVSINLASTIDWGLYITDLQGSTTKVITKVGDGVIYLGPQVEHWRNLLITDKPEFYIQTFFHYVKANGKYAKYKDDKFLT